jgi:hypothetical protein
MIIGGMAWAMKDRVSAWTAKGTLIEELDRAK